MKAYTGSAAGIDLQAPVAGCWGWPSLRSWCTNSRLKRLCRTWQTEVPLPYSHSCWGALTKLIAACQVKLAGWIQFAGQLTKQHMPASRYSDFLLTVPMPEGAALGASSAGHCLDQQMTGICSGANRVSASGTALDRPPTWRPAKVSSLLQQARSRCHPQALISVGGNARGRNTTCRRAVCWHPQQCSYFLTDESQVSP